MSRNTSIGLAIAFLAVLFVLFQPKPNTPTAEIPDPLHRQPFQALYGTPVINGIADDAAWQSAAWLPLDQVWIGQAPGANDFSGRYKILWDENNLYVLAEITDDTLIDIHPDGLLKYWDDDCLEIFVDEDASGGDHQYNYNAFAYHIALDGKVADIGPDRNPHFYDDHCTTRRTASGKTSVWEVAVKIFDGKQYEDGGDNIPKMLKAGKKMGFALAYCDNDHSPERENFIGSVKVEGEDKNRGWIDAGIFGLLELK
ncbi:MAG: sugar-binding protein [Haliscomenobacteraceae bacterium CHB4]|nr:hypothetical protein [Saprospiraceae bacterium]MCE7926229.1 sugar-binding protein [Haliscomenobacteraceae bacterium CHB4]